MNSEEARLVRDAVDAAGVVFMEGFHYPYHPLFLRVCRLLAEGVIGEVAARRGDPQDAGSAGLRPALVARASAVARRWTSAATASRPSGSSASVRRWGASRRQRLA